MTVVDPRFSAIAPLHNLTSQTTTDGDDIISIEEYEISGASFDGLGGVDTLQLDGGSHFVLTMMYIFQNFEIIRGSEYGDTIELSESQLAGITAIDGVANASPSENYENFLRLEGLSLDLRNVTISNIKSILLTPGSDNAVVTVDDHDTALKLDGASVRNDHLILDGVLLTPAEITGLHRQGIGRISNADGTLVSLDVAPVVTGLSGDWTAIDQSGTALIDAQGDAVVSDDSGLISSLSVVPLAYERGTIGLIRTSRVSFSGDFEQPIRDVFVDGILVARYVEFEGAARFDFTAAATQDRVTQILHALTYTDDPSTFGSAKTTEIRISISDYGNRETETIVTVAANPASFPAKPAAVVPDKTLIGTRIGDKLVGAAGNDTLSGRLGNDVLTGGTGKDIFIFDTKPGKKNVDKITDFRVVDDSIHFENAVFKGLGKKTGMLKKAAFWKGAKAHDASDRIVYNKKIGALYYDEDGSGSKAAVKFATINKVTLTEKDFFIV